jgi:class 3 adenylate cyclase
VTRDELYRLLDERLEAPAQAAAIEKAIWLAAGRERAVLVADLSGFTRVTQQKGILHFLEGFRRAVALARPVFDRTGAIFWKTAADNLMASFPRVPEALEAAAALAATPLDPCDGIHWCLGISFGRILELEDDLFGDAVNVAYKLGEDVAGPGEVLVSEPAAACVDGAPLEGPATVTTGGICLPYYRLRV